MTSLKGKSVFITGGSRGIGRAIALRFAADGARIAIAAKTADAHPTLPGTIHSVADEIRQAGGEALPLLVDVRDEQRLSQAIAETAAAFGGIDIVVNNASAISPTGMRETPLKRYDLVMGINVRGSFACCQAALPYLAKSANPHILTLSPPLTTGGFWFGKYSAYALSKFAMTMVTLGVAAEMAEAGIAANTLWPRTLIATDAVRVHYAEDYRRSRKPEAMADAAHAIVTKDSRTVTGRSFIDEDVLRAEGVADLSAYAVEPGAELMPDILLDEPASLAAYGGSAG